MDAKPQRLSRPQPSFSQANNENMIPAIFSMDQRNKAIGAPIARPAGEGLKPNAKRTAFGDVSNVLRSVPDMAFYGFKSTATAGNPPSVIPSATGGKENTAQSAGFLAPAQRAKLSGSAVALAMAETNVVRPQPTQIGKTHIGAVKQTSVVFSANNEIDHVAGTHAAAATQVDVNYTASDALAQHSNVNRVKQSPRQHKSQPCLKNALDHQVQKKVLRRTQSRLPEDRPRLNDVVVFTDYKAADEREIDGLSESDVYDADADDAPYVDAVEAINKFVMPVLDNSTDNVQAHDEGAAVEAHRFLEPEPLAQGEFRAVGEDHLDFLAEVPTIPTAGAAEAEEPWDDDGDFYEEQGYTTAHSFRSLGDNTTGGLTTIMMPKVTARIQNELDLARSIVEASLTPEEIDDEAWDISMVAEYGEDINDYMRELEVKMLPSPHYMDMQTEIQWSMRAVLMEWLIQVHARFNLLPETLFLTVNYIDRFLSSKIVSVNKLQLVGATAIFIAAKYEEIVCPSIQEIVYMVDGGYTADEVLKAERFMLSMLGFELGWPGPMSFLRRISKADDYDLETRTLAKYFLEVAVMDERFVASPASFLAAGSHCLARLMLHKGDWSMAHTHYSGYTWSQVRPLANVMIHCCRDPRAHHAAVYEKYASNKFKKASIFVEEELRRGFSMPPPHMHRQQSSLTDSFTDNQSDSIGALRSNHLDILIQAQS